MKKVLIITYYWPPSGGSGVQRWVKFAKYLPSMGWQPVIYTPENPEAPSKDFSLLDDIPREAIVIKRHISELYTLYRRLTGKKGKAEVNPINHQQKSFLQSLVLKLRGNLFVPDPKVGWVRPSVRFLKAYLKDNPVDMIISTGPPHSMHLIAGRLADKTWIPWIADFRDPWTKIFYFKHLGLGKAAYRKHCRLEQEVLDKANAVIAVSPMVEDEFREMTDTPVHLITNGFDESDFDYMTGNDGYFNITHTGLFAADGNPDNVWKSLADKAGSDPEFASLLRIRLVGKTDAAIIGSLRMHGLDKYTEDLGYRDHTVAVKEQLNAAVLLLPLRQEPEYKATLPGKLFEYIASRRPVLGIGQTDGAMAGIINDTKAGNVYEWEDADGIRKFIDKSWENFRSGISEVESEDVERFSRKRLTSDLVGLMESIISPDEDKK